MERSEIIINFVFYCDYNVRFCGRAGVAGGAVYLLNDQGVWSPHLNRHALTTKLTDAVPQEATDFTKKVRQERKAPCTCL